MELYLSIQRGDQPFVMLGYARLKRTLLFKRPRARDIKTHLGLAQTRVVQALGAEQDKFLGGQTATRTYFLPGNFKPGKNPPEICHKDK